MGMLRLLVCLLLLGASYALYPSGPHLDQILPRGDNVSVEVPLAVPIKFYGHIYQSIFVNDNGMLSFLTEIPKFFNEPFPLEYPIVAPFYSNVDTRGAGTISYRESRDQDVLNTIARKVATLYPSYPDFKPLAAFIVTWDGVGYFNSKNDKVNTYQAVVASDGSETFVEFLYPLDGITWIRADSTKTSLPDARGQAGVFSPGGKLAVVKGSGTDRVYNLPRWTNTLTPGEYMFRVGNIEDTGQPETPQRSTQNEVLEEDEPQTCSDGAILCHKASDCFDETEGGFCCRCQKGYFGDGRNCLDYDSHRMNGKVNISLNGVESKNLNMQAFIVTGDGRTYTAISGVPQYIGYSMQLLISLGSFVGFLFAKPIGEAPNGYQLTGGVVNQTVDISFGSHHRVTIHQRYSGLDLFEQVKMEAEVIGTTPHVAAGAKLSVLDFQEHYTRTAPGLFRSHSRHTIEYADSSKETFEINVDQTIQFTEYCPSVYKSLSSLRLKSSRHYLNYEPKDMILRLASTNKISQNTEGHDPCIEGHVTCVANSSCLVEDDSFRCVCNPGFQTLPDQSSDFGCVDINECEDGSANCDKNALCVNEVGTYACQCFEGYTGNGRHCQAIEEPKVPTLENGLCRGNAFQFSCNCDYGFEKIPDSSIIGFRCEDIDECSNSPDEPCDGNAECTNTFGSFTCQCHSGFIGDGFSCVEEEGSCINLDCPEGTTCRETSGRPECVCLEGYVGSPPYCRPEGLCETENDCKENHICQWNSTVRLSICSCREGYIKDGSSCLPPANEQALVRTCMNGECWCPTGYLDNGELCIYSPVAPSPNKQPTCRELNNCNENALCIYVQNKKTYECKCKPGFEGDGFSCTEFEMSCDRSPICDLNADCHYDSNSGRYMCICNEGYQGDGTTCFAIVEQCPVCHENAVCNSGTCECQEGYVGDGIENCEREIQGCDTLGNCSPNADCVYDTVEQGHRCKCRLGYEGDGYSCNETITCHQHPEICNKDAKCVLSYSSYTYNCQCNEGYFGDGINCKVINRQEEEFLLLNKGVATIKLPFEPLGNNIGRPIQINGNQRAIGIAIDCIEGRVYWSDIMGQKIKSSKYDGTDAEDFITSGIKSPEGLAIDWINRILYWTDSSLRVIASAGIEDKKINTIISNGLSNPRGIAVHPQLRKIFWSDWNRKNPTIESADLNGEKREILVQSPRVKLPNSLAIDWDSNDICWADAGLKNIECFDLYRRISRTVVQNSEYPFGLAITSNMYYWTDWFTGFVESSRKGSGTKTKSIALPIGGGDKLYGLAAVTSSCPR